MTNRQATAELSEQANEAGRSYQHLDDHPSTDRKD